MVNASRLLLMFRLLAEFEQLDFKIGWIVKHPLFGLIYELVMQIISYKFKRHKFGGILVYFTVEPEQILTSI